MEAYNNKVVVVLALVVVAALSSAAVKGQLCGMSSEGLNSCQPAVNGANPPADPSEQCCTALKNANLQCLCQYKPYMKAYGINADQAMKLPKKCKLSTSFPCAN